MDAAVDAQIVVETDAVAYAAAVNEDHDMGPQVALVVEYITTQPWIDCERSVERIAQYGGGRVDLRHFGEASQLLREDQFCHKNPQQ